jgi:hypothetical protein
MDDTGPALRFAALTKGELGISAAYGSFLAEVHRTASDASATLIRSFLM